LPDTPPPLWEHPPLPELLAAERAWLYAQAAAPALHARLLIGPAPFAVADGWIGLHLSGAQRVGGALSGVLTELPLVDGACERVVLHHVLEELPAPSAMLKECVRVLRPGGKLLLFGLEPLSLWHPWLRTATGRGGRRLRLRWSGRLGAALERCGLEGVRRCSIGPRWPNALALEDAGTAHQGLAAVFRATFVLEATRSSSCVIPLRPRSAEQTAVGPALLPSASHRNAVAA
jgi:SAM-dependent methyltransferase